jgi:hypothetical protein
MTEVWAVTLETGLRLLYAEQGDRAGPVFVLLPGPIDSWLSYEPVLERLPPSISGRRRVPIAGTATPTSRRSATEWRTSPPTSCPC